MSYKVKGSAGPFIQSTRLSYEPEDGTYFNEITYAGSAAAIAGLSSQFRVKNNGHYAVMEDNGAGQLTFRKPIALKPEDLENSVRYEVTTEFLEQDIFRHKTVSDQADAYEVNLAPGADSWRKQVEDAVDSHAAPLDPIFARTVTHLRKGYTGFEREYIVMKRSRKIPFTGTGAFPKANIFDGRFIYSTAQLGVPGPVAFALPNPADLPASNWTDVVWGWRRRPSSVIFQGDFIEQSSEFILAEWSLLLYEISPGPADW